MVWEIVFLNLRIKLEEHISGETYLKLQFLTRIVEHLVVEIMSAKFEKSSGKYC